ncbi:hypothetical protein Tco_1551330, partial [Tanacetum coccineum]
KMEDLTTEKPENKTDAEWTILHRQGIINQLVGMGIKFEDDIQGLWLLGTLPDTWETFRTSLSNSAPDGVITMELAKGSILNKETRRKSQGSWSQKGGGEVKAEARVTENKKKNYNNEKNKHKNDDDGDDNTEVNTTTDEFFVCYDYDMVNLANDDSSAFGVVRMGNTGLSRIAGIGDICLKFDTGMELVLHNVKHVPDMRLNICLWAIQTRLLTSPRSLSGRGTNIQAGAKLIKQNVGKPLVKISAY